MSTEEVIGQYEADVREEAAAARERALGVLAAQKGLKEAAEAGRLAAAERDSRFRGFVAPVHKNDRILVNPTERKVIVINDPNSPTGRRSLDTEGDVFIVFADGICTIDTSTPEGAKQLAWALAHPEICRDIEDPYTEAWFTLKDGQTPKTNSDPTIPAGLDIDRLLAGDPGALNNARGSSLKRAREALDTANTGA